MSKFVLKLWKLLDGKKAYIGSGIIFLAGGLKALDSINEDIYQALLAFGFAVSAFGIRDAIRKL